MRGSSQSHAGPRRTASCHVGQAEPRNTAQDVVGFLRPLPCPADSAGQRRAAWDPSGPSLGRVGSRGASPNHLDPRGATSRHSRGEGHAGLRWSRHTPAGRCLTTRRCDCSGSRRVTQEPLGPPQAADTSGKGNAWPRGITPDPSPRRLLSLFSASRVCARMSASTAKRGRSAEGVQSEK
jgi:hypothetical protein